MEKLYWSISEVSDILGENLPTVRSWANRFEGLVNPGRNAKGNRIFDATQLELMKQIHYLVRTKGMTLNGAEKQMRTAKAGVDKELKLLERLKSIRNRLEEIKKNI